MGDAYRNAEQVAYSIDMGNASLSGAFFEFMGNAPQQAENLAGEILFCMVKCPGV